MVIQYARSYIDELYAQRDLHTLYQVISVLGDHRSLREEFWLFCRLLEWEGAPRSGVWQYYECVAPDTYERVANILARLGLTQIDEPYRSGAATWRGPAAAGGVDRWIDDHEDEVQQVLFDLIAPHRASLYPSL
jgi:hypothetical protein